MKLYNDPERGIVFNPKWPVEPVEENSEAYFKKYCESHNFPNPKLEYLKDKEAYNSALQTAIREANGFENHNEMFFIIQDACMIKGAKQFKLEPATFYNVPDMKLKLIDACNSEVCPVDAGCEQCEKPIQLYRIVSEPKQEQKPEQKKERCALIRIDYYYQPAFHGLACGLMRSNEDLLDADTASIDPLVLERLEVRFYQAGMEALWFHLKNQAKQDKDLKEPNQNRGHRQEPKVETQEGLTPSVSNFDGHILMIMQEFKTAHDEYSANVCDPVVNPNGENTSYFRGKADAYGYAARQLMSCMKWHGKLNVNP